MHLFGALGDGLFHGFDGGGIGRIARVGDQEDIGVKAAFFLHEVGFGRKITLHADLFVSQEWCGVERIGFALFSGETVSVDHPLVIALETVVADQQREVFQLVPAVRFARMGNDDLRVLLEHGRHVDDGDVFLCCREGLQQVAAHVEIHPAGQHQRAVVHLWAARHDGDI